MTMDKSKHFMMMGYIPYSPPGMSLEKFCGGKNISTLENGQ